MQRIAWLIPAILIAVGLFAADPNEELLTASRKGDLAAVRQMIEKGVAIETKTAYGQTPLFLAAMNGHEEVVRFLLEKGASPNITDTFYKMPMLVFILERGHLGVAKLLIQKGANVPDPILAQLLATGEPDVVQTVLEYGKPSPAVIDSAYENALPSGRAEVVALLKKAGAREPAPAFKVDVSVLESYAGSYKSSAIPIDIKAFVRDGTLYMQAAGQSEFPLKAKSPTLFEFAQAQIVVEFDSPTSFTIKQGSSSYLFKKEVAQ